MAKLVDLFKGEGVFNPSPLNKRLRKQIGRGTRVKIVQSRVQEDRAFSNS